MLSLAILKPTATKSPEQQPRSRSLLLSLLQLVGFEKLTDVSKREKKKTRKKSSPKKESAAEAVVKETEETAEQGEAEEIKTEEISAEENPESESQEPEPEKNKKKGDQWSPFFLNLLSAALKKIALTQIKP